MKEELVATCVKNFVSKASTDYLRLDARNFDEYRPIEVHFGKEWGSCQVSFGETKVLAIVTCDVQLPKATRPNEGLLHLNVELSPMAAVHFEAGPQSDLGVHLNRLLEKFFKESRCVDLESLCIVAEDKVWNVRVDISVLNSDGNLIGCCSAAALAALMHFRRPDFTLLGEQVIIHGAAEREPLPLSLHHHPLALTYAIFNNGEQVLADPSSVEERVSQAQLVLAVNTYRELCGLHLSGTAQAAPDLILQCANKSAAFSAMIIGKIKEALQADFEAKSSGPFAGLADCINLSRVLASSQDRNTFCVKGSGKPEVKHMEIEETFDDSDVEVICVGENSAELRPIKEKALKPWEPSAEGNSWLPATNEKTGSEEVEEEDDDDDSSSDESEGKGESDDEVQVVGEITQEDRVIDRIELTGDSSEEETVEMNVNDMNNA